MFTILIPKIKSLVTKESIKGLMLLIFWILVYCVFLFFYFEVYFDTNQCKQ